MRHDQATLLNDRVGGEIPAEDPGDPASYLLLVEAIDGQGQGAGGWSRPWSVSPPASQVHARGRRLVEMLGDSTGRATASVADFRGLDLEGHPVAGRTPCPCGSGARSKHCPHQIEAYIYATAATFISQKEWASRDPNDPLIAGGQHSAVPDGHVRVAAGLHTLSAKPLARGMVDVTEEGASVAAAQALLANLHAALVAALPMLAAVELVEGHTPLNEFDVRAV
jgi:hypothetical protein